MQKKDLCMNFPQHTLIKPLIKWHKYQSTPSFKANTELDISEIKNTSEEDILSRFPRIKDFTKTDKNGNTMLHELSRANYFYAIKALLVNPSRTREIINIQNKLHQTPLDLVQDIKLRRFLVTKGAKHIRTF